jgi:glyceraldehyde-3-phosphate dehydrogenase type I
MNSPVRLAINGYGRIGRCFLRALHESPLRSKFQVVAINEPSDLDSMVYLTRFDSTHGIFPGRVDQADNALIIDGESISVTHADTPDGVDWGRFGIDMLIECSGHFSTYGQLQGFVNAGCPRVLVSHPTKGAGEVDFTVVYGVNHGQFDPGARIVSNASCTTNAIVPVLDQLDRAFGIEQAFLTTLHSVMNDQPMIDGYHHSDPRRTRSAMQSIIPVSTGLAQGVERLLPGLKGKVRAKAIRVPILNVSAIDFVVNLGSDVTRDSLNALMRDAAQAQPVLIAVSSHPHASVDFNHDSHSAIIDASQTECNGPRSANLLVWFDNEWGFASRMLDVADYWAGRL